MCLFDHTSVSFYQDPTPGKQNSAVVRVFMDAGRGLALRPATHDNLAASQAFYPKTQKNPLRVS